MKGLGLLFLVISIASYSQDTIIQLDTVKKIVVINSLPVEFYYEIKTNGTGLEVTMYESGTTFNLPNISGSNYFLSFIQGQAPSVFNSKNSGYIMLLVKDEFTWLPKYLFLKNTRTLYTSTMA